VVSRAPRGTTSDMAGQRRRDTAQIRKGVRTSYPIELSSPRGAGEDWHRSGRSLARQEVAEAWVPYCVLWVLSRKRAVYLTKKGEA